jgi:hypothetical protein
VTIGDNDHRDTVARDGRRWRLGTAADVSWITAATSPGFAITSAIPPVFDAYSTIVDAEHGEWAAPDRTIVELLTRHTPEQPWWLGYLDTGGADVVFPDAPRVQLYANWSYVLVEAGPDQAETWRHDDWSGTLPDLLFPQDRGWLLSHLWDDDWRCLGGPTALINDFTRQPHLETRTVDTDEPATPPGHHAF